MTQADAWIGVQTSLIRPPVKLRVVHALQDRAVNQAARSGVKNSGDSAHDFVEVLAY